MIVVNIPSVFRFLFKTFHWVWGPWTSMRHPSKHQALQRALQWHSGSEHHALNLSSNDPFASHLWLWLFRVNADTTTPKRCFNPGPFGKPTHGSTWEFCHFLWPWMIHLQLHRPAGGSSLVSKGCGFFDKKLLRSSLMEWIVSYSTIITITLLFGNRFIDRRERIWFSLASLFEKDFCCPVVLWPVCRSQT